MQEARIGVFRALREHRPERGALPGFVELCARRAVIMAVKGATRDKHLPLNTAVTQARGSDGVQVEALTLVADPRPAVEDLLARRAQFRRLVAAISTELSELERDCLVELIAGGTYDQIAASLEVSNKTVDTALTRGRQKLRKAA